MKKSLLITLFMTIWTLGMAASDARAQVAYGISIVCADSVECGNVGTRTVDGYSGTWLDYYAGLYYDPDVIGDLYRTDIPETSLSSGRMIGYADLVPAEVYLSTSNFVEGKTYCTYSQHAVWSYFYYSPFSQWFDPFRYDFRETGPTPWPGSPFGYYYVIPRRHFLGWTQACITIPLPPTPTPTPTPPPPTPTPTPTPCDSLVEGPSCTDYIVKLTASPAVLRPSGTAGGNNTAKVNLCIEPAEANKSATLQLVRRPANRDSGGHLETLHTGLRPIGKLARVSGTTGADGCFSTTYSPPHISGMVGINGSISGTSTGVDITAVVPAFSQLPPSEDYNLVGQTAPHPSNHWGTQGAIDHLPLIASDYRNQFYGGNLVPEQERISFNDMSLEWGGKFDLGKKWADGGAHAEHREGTSTDVKCCGQGGVPANRWSALRSIFHNRGFGINDETNSDAPHWHLRYGDLRDTGASSMVDGIEQNPDSFVEVNPAQVSTSDLVEIAWSSTLDRQSTQEEWQNWHQQIVDAKAEGQTQLIDKAKELEHQLFDSSDYITRNRSNEDFIEDVFQAHLFRGATDGEKSYWTNILDSLSDQSQQVARMQMIETLESRQAFTDALNRIVDLKPPFFPVSISGRVKTATGQAIPGAIVTLTDSHGVSRIWRTSSFGNYFFDNVLTGESYVLTASSRRYSFAPRSINLWGELTGFDIVAGP